jgi:dihydromethanopterin reductase (acceptor)
MDACPFEAIITGKLINIRMRDVDIENTHKLIFMEGITVLKDPNEVREHII